MVLVLMSHIEKTKKYSDYRELVNDDCSCFRAIGVGGGGIEPLF